MTEGIYNSITEAMADMPGKFTRDYTFSMIGDKVVDLDNPNIQAWGNLLGSNPHTWKPKYSQPTKEKG